MTMLSKVNNDSINENLRKRFENGEIYVCLTEKANIIKYLVGSLYVSAYSGFLIKQTYIGHVLISVNPFRDLGIYTDEVLNSYTGKNRLEVG